MSQFDLLKKTIASLDRLHISYMLTGSLASSLLGDPRSTHDIDIVIEVARDKLAALSREYSSDDYYVSDTAIEQAIKHQGMFNVVDMRGGDKIDFWLLTDDPFDISRFARRRQIEIEGMPISISSPEDTIVMKLRWSQNAGGSERHFRDALRVYNVQLAILDLEYLDQWTAALGLTEDWQRLLHRARATEP